MTAAQTLRSLTGIAVVAALAGCSANPMHAMTGRIMTGHAEQHVTPEMFAMSDSRLVCASGTALEPLMASFARVGEPSDKSLTLLWLLAGACAEQQAWDAEMRYLRAERKADLEAARDARSDQQRWLQLAAERRLQSYRHALRAYDYDASQAEPSCPSLATPQDEVTFLLGLMTGLQAILNDANSGALADVPRDIALQTERAAACVDNTRWAGMPDALRASVWTLLPDSRPSPDVQPLEVLRTSSEMGVTQGLRVAGALEVI
ncbi:MAG: hypothetical protein LPK85_12305, partial [Gammaproteobacteria bacterium]|nr:hypothetical protein [Gammaproteobacteria bacterium]